MTVFYFTMKKQLGVCLKFSLTIFICFGMRFELLESNYKHYISNFS